jgi:hypothetical protein
MVYYGFVAVLSQATFDGVSYKGISGYCLVVSLYVVHRDLEATETCGPKFVFSSRLSRQKCLLYQCRTRTRIVQGKNNFLVSRSVT